MLPIFIKADSRTQLMGCAHAQVTLALHDESKIRVIVIGGGNAWLTYLARGGKRVLVLERRQCWRRGVTEEVFPGFKFSVCSYVVSLLRPEDHSGVRSASSWAGDFATRRHVYPSRTDHLWRVNDHAKTRREIARPQDLMPKLTTNTGKAMIGWRISSTIMNMTPPDPASPIQRVADF